jgi:hypothetical protein
VTDSSEDQVRNGDEINIWEDFDGDDSEPIGVDELERLPLEYLPHGTTVVVRDSYFPDVSLHREAERLVCVIEEHLYTKYWEHRFSAYAFAEAMERAVVRLSNEGEPISNPTRNAEDVHIFVTWELRLSPLLMGKALAAAIRAANDLVWQRAYSILENSDSVLVLGKDTAPDMERLERIAKKLESLGYYPYIIKHQPDVPGQSVVQKVMRYALCSKFVVVENTAASGHLYEFPHVAKAAECITVVLQADGHGATWMFEDGYAKHRHWHKVTYRDDEIESAVETGARWAENSLVEFASYQRANLPWMQSPTGK